MTVPPNAKGASGKAPQNRKPNSTSLDSIHELPSRPRPSPRVSEGRWCVTGGGYLLKDEPGPHCGQCLGSCPHGLPIHDVLRQRMYFEDYGWEKEGMRLYSKLEKNAYVSASCSAPCLGSCPVGVDIRARMQGAHDLLSLV